MRRGDRERSAWARSRLDCVGIGIGLRGRSGLDCVGEIEIGLRGGERDRSA
ncbi:MULTISPECIES: hypothetical protein [unclassified Paenibacillus]|uniref:hypothetical protein n=1 Tax=unclassified Paenibacillus TaxID=185978 RepID=UPI00363146A6